ncbi:DUF368 domain-containing protein [Salipaludibacillus sp. CUR1]|nr:DUF368 domain-containing protein [Salipaludibacillus sp. CUR1]
MILGIYEQLIYSLSVLTTKRRLEALPFLMTFGFGMVIGLLGSLFFIDYFLTHYRTQTLTFFIGVIIGFLSYLYREAIDQSGMTLKIKHI